MNRESLDILLMQADGDATTPQFDSGELCASVYALADRRRRIRRGGAVTLAVTLVCGTGLWLNGMRTDRVTPVVLQSEIGPSVSPSSVDPETLKREIRQLRAEADGSLRIVRRMIESRARNARLSAYRKRAAVADSLMTVRSEAEVAARIMVEHADRLARRSQTQASAVRAWRRTIDLFPKTVWARIARERISNTQNEQGDKT
ncbi:MAG: hypothetical protein ACE5EC_00295 [Phycisphaerae bacterium]